MGPPGRVACHGAGAARETIIFSVLRSSSFTQVIELVRGDFVQMLSRSAVFRSMTAGADAAMLADMLGSLAEEPCTMLTALMKATRQD